MDPVVLLVQGFPMLKCRVNVMFLVQVYFLHLSIFGSKCTCLLPYGEVSLSGADARQCLFWQINKTLTLSAILRQKKDQRATQKWIQKTKTKKWSQNTKRKTIGWLTHSASLGKGNHRERDKHVSQVCGEDLGAAWKELFLTGLTWKMCNVGWIHIGEPYPKAQSGWVHDFGDRNWASKLTVGLQMEASERSPKRLNNCFKRERSTCASYWRRCFR